jgi:hypothetical protein
MNQLSIFYKSIIAVILLASCESHEQKSDEAFNQFKDDKMAIKDTIKVSKDTTVVVVEKNQPLKKYEKIDEDEKFNKAIQTSVHTNELIIKKFLTIKIIKL